MEQKAGQIRGTYCVQLHCKQGVGISIGKLGSFRFEAGYYLYVGSAFGPGGVHARLRHHCNVSLRPHWHLDYLRPYAEVINTWYVAEQRHEHRWAEILEQTGALNIPVRGFGSSDCDCESHLFVSNKAMTRKILQKYLCENIISMDCSELLNY